MALSERLQRNIDATSWRGKIPMNYVYTAGRAGEKFFRALKERGELVGARCEKCGIVHLPPRIFCERCFSRIEESIVEVPARGVVHTFTFCHETYDEKRKERPSIVAFIRFEGTVGGLMHRLEEVALADVRIGMPVKPVLKPPKEREGSILDIRHFKPA